MTEVQPATLTYHPKALKQLAKLESTVAARSFKFGVLFQQNINHKSLHFKRLRGYTHLHSARVSDDYRALLRHVGNHHYLLLAVLPRQDVYDRLDERMSYFINETTGGVEVIDPSELARLNQVDAREVTKPQWGSARSELDRLFTAFTDNELRDVGVATVLLPSVREIRTETGLFRLADELPTHTSEVLVELAAGTPIEAILDKITDPIRPLEPVDTDDFAAAAERPATQAVRCDDPAVEAMLSGDFQAWRLFLHPTQRSVVERHYRGPARVSGGPGTGKTVVALHRAAKLARALPSDQKILVTTYTENLAADLNAKLSMLLTPEELSRVETVHIDKITYRMAAEAGPVKQVISNNGPLLKYWREVLDQAGDKEFDKQFCLDEWREVVCGHLVTDVSRYLTTHRAGRGRRLTRSQRMRVWTLCEAFNARLESEERQTFGQMQMTAALAAEERRGLEPARYTHIVVDEAQDLTEAHWRMLRALVPESPNDLFIVGDTHQRIYGTPLALAPLGINIRGRSSRLTLSYRTTREILETALGMVSGESFDDLDGDLDTLAGYRSIMSGVYPRYVATETEEAQWDAVVEQAKAWGNVKPSDIAVCVPNKGDVKVVAARLAADGIKASVVDGKKAGRADEVHVSTMNRLKGLEYRYLIIAGVGAEDFPRGYVTRLSESDPVAYRHALKKERCLLFVAATRVRDALTIVWRGEPCQFLTVTP